MNNFYALWRSIFIYVFLFFSLTTFAQVGVGTTDPQSSLDVNGGVALREGPTINVGNGINIDLGTIKYSLYRITDPTSDFSISTFLSPNGLSAADGQLLTLINTTPYNMTIVNDNGSNANPQRRILCPGERNLIISGSYSSVTFQYNINLLRWVVLSYSNNAATMDSITLANNTSIFNTSFTQIPGMSITFIAKKPTVFVFLTASGFGYTNSMSYVQFRVRNVTNNNILGGTNTKIQSFDDVTGTITPWSASFSKLLSGLTVGNTYTLRVDGAVYGIRGTYTALIYPSTYPETDHLTLTVMQ